MEENEVDRHKLVNWRAKVVKCDAFGAPVRTHVEEALATCEKELERYAARVYSEEADAQ